MPAQKPHRSRQDYQTDRDFLVAVKRLLGIKAFTHDFAADRYNTQAPTYWDKDMNSLSYDPSNWAIACQGGWGWLNPEYADIDPWVERCEQAREEGASIALLVPAGIGSNWFRDHVVRSAFVFALNGRLCFIQNWKTLRYDHDDLSLARKFKKGDRMYLSKPLYPKDCILALYSPDWEAGFDVWTWRS
jgi:hypothetical protein